MIVNNRSYWSFLKTNNVTVRVNPRKNTPQEIYRVNALVDTGSGEQKAMLEHQGYVLKSQSGALKFDVALPLKMDGLRFLYSGHQKKLARSVHELTGKQGDYEFEQIVPEVIRPGDILIFRKCPRRDQITIIEAMRPVRAGRNSAKNKKIRSHHAL